MPVTQTREEILKRLEEVEPKTATVKEGYVYLLLEIILDVLTDIRDNCDSIKINVQGEGNDV